MPRKPALFLDNRVCCCCLQATPSRVRLGGGRDIMAISATIYRRGQNKGMQRAAQRVQVCENCFVRAVVQPEGTQGRSLTYALLRSLSECYSGLVEAGK